MAARPYVAGYTGAGGMLSFTDNGLSIGDAVWCQKCHSEPKRTKWPSCRSAGPHAKQPNMIEPIEYQSPLPAGYQLRYLVNEQSVHISRDPPGSGLLWSEASVPLILLVSFGIFAVLFRRWVAGLNLPHEISSILYVVGYGALAIWVFVNVRRARQNMGIVMEIAVSADTLYWRKQNVWGSKEYFWPLASVDSVSVQNRLLKVYRRRGPALAAFSFVKPEERQYACDVLNAAISQHRHNQPTIPARLRVDG